MLCTEHMASVGEQQQRGDHLTMTLVVRVSIYSIYLYIYISTVSIYLYIYSIYSIYSIYTCHVPSTAVQPDTAGTAQDFPPSTSSALDNVSHVHPTLPLPLSSTS